MEETVRVTWITTVEERHESFIPLSEYNAMIESGDHSDTLAPWELGKPVDTIVIDRFLINER